ACSGQLDGRGEADGPRRTGDERDLSRERLLRFLSELGLLEAPVLHVEELPVVERLVAAERLCGRLDAKRVLGNIRGDGRGLACLRRADDADTRNQQHARVRIELLARDSFGADLLGEISVVTGAVGIDRGAQLRAEGIEVV